MRHMPPQPVRQQARVGRSDQEGSPQRVLLNKPPFNTRPSRVLHGQFRARERSLATHRTLTAQSDCDRVGRSPEPWSITERQRRHQPNQSKPRDLSDSRTCKS